MRVVGASAQTQSGVSARAVSSRASRDGPLALDLHEMAHSVHRTAHGWVVGALDGAADLAEPEGKQRCTLLPRAAVHGFGLRDLQRAHQAGSSARSALAPSPSPEAGPIPSTCGTVS